jgi:hypothetical protein
MRTHTARTTLAGLALVIAACGGKTQSAQQAKTDDSIDSALAVLNHPSAPEAPKVPFDHQPCQSLSNADETSFGVQPPMTNKADRAPAGLAYDNVCSYWEGGDLAVQVGYQTVDDYQANKDGNHSTSHADPTDLPGGFYDKQGGLWFTKNGYYVVVSGESKFADPAARLIATKL